MKVKTCVDICQVTTQSSNSQLHRVPQRILTRIAFLSIRSFMQASTSTGHRFLSGRIGSSTSEQSGVRVSATITGAIQHEVGDQLFAAALLPLTLHELVRSIRDIIEQ